MIKRANTFGVQKFLFAAGYIEDAKVSLEMSKRSEHFYATVGIHPCRAMEPYKGTEYADMSDEMKKSTLQKYLGEIDDMLTQDKDRKFVMVGECGLDYDRLEYASKEA